MRTAALASSLIFVAWTAQAADLSGEYNFIQDNAPPARSVVGHLELGVGWLGVYFPDELSPPFEDTDLGLFEGWGRANIPFGNGFNLEAETGGLALFNGNGQSASNIGAFGHLWFGPDGYRVGAFGGVTFGSFYTGVAGLEGEVDLGNLTLGAQGLYNFADEGATPGISNDYWGVRGWAEFYVMANTKIAGELGWWQTDEFLGYVGKGDPVHGPNLFSAAASVEHRFAGRPISLFARAEYVQTEGADIPPNVKTFDQTVSVFGGIRIFMDGDGTTLQEHDHQVPFDVRLPAIATMSGELRNFGNTLGGGPKH